MDLSSSSCLRKRLFSLLRAFNWKGKETYAGGRQKEKNIVRRLCRDRLMEGDSGKIE